MKLLFAIEAQVYQHLVIARTRHVNLFADCACLCYQVVLDARVHILIGGRNGKCAGCLRSQDVTEGMFKGLVFGILQDTYFFEHGGVGKRAPYIMAYKGVIEGAVLRSLKALYLLMQAVSFLPQLCHCLDTPSTNGELEGASLPGKRKTLAPFREH